MVHNMGFRGYLGIGGYTWGSWEYIELVLGAI